MKSKIQQTEQRIRRQKSVNNPSIIINTSEVKTNQCIIDYINKMGNETTFYHKDRSSYSMNFRPEMTTKIVSHQQKKIASPHQKNQHQHQLRATQRNSSMDIHTPKQIQARQEAQSQEKLKKLNKLKIQARQEAQSQGKLKKLKIQARQEGQSQGKLKKLNKLKIQAPQEAQSQGKLNKLNKLNLENDELRKELIRISTDLTLKLNKKNYIPKGASQRLGNSQNKKALKKELENSYKQVDMYKKKIEELKRSNTSLGADGKLVAIENKVGLIDHQINEIMEEIKSRKNVMVNQSQGMKKNEGWDNIEELKGEVEAVKVQLREMQKESKRRQKLYNEQHSYMMALDRKVRQLNGEYVPEVSKQSKGEEKEKVEEREIEEIEEEMELLKIKHDEYHKRINLLLATNKQMKSMSSELKQELGQKKKKIEALKYRRAALAKQVKGNLHFFATRQSQDPTEEETSEFESYEDLMKDRISPIQEEIDERGTFDIEHLRDSSIKSKLKEGKEMDAMKAVRRVAEEPKQEPKQWKKRAMKLIEKGKPKSGEKEFGTGLNKRGNSDMRMVMMNIWMNMKKQITAIQPFYMVDGEVIDGRKSSENVEDEYRVSYELEESDYIKSILGTVGKEGFIEYLVLQSHSGKISRVGREQTIGDNFSIGMVKEQTPIQITGASSMDGNYYRINRLQFQILIEPN